LTVVLAEGIRGELCSAGEGSKGEAIIAYAGKLDEGIIRGELCSAGARVRPFPKIRQGQGHHRPVRMSIV
jgi:hypothetical protein